ncbi:hypothetical protein [Metapseudomonas resinovorans]|uniref:hypothetical protein n=1 Tax=Metapseudomonas resinovorans TaxID=53412 RepID=UPI000406B389|nr:hypothetical protein [Pseudomonas resinovorans]
MTDEQLEQQRRLYEAACEAKAKALGYDFDSAVMVRDIAGLYVVPSVQTGWWAWQASLTAQHGGLRVVFDGPPGHECGRFVECEDSNGRSVNAGVWRERQDGLWELVINGECFGDAYQGARDDLAIWKRRALEAEAAIRRKDQIINHLVCEAQGETRMGEPLIKPARQLVGEVKIPWGVAQMQLSDHSARSLNMVEVPRESYRLDGWVIRTASGEYVAELIAFDPALLNALLGFHASDSAEGQA